MIFLSNSAGDIRLVSPETIQQGSCNYHEIVLIGPFPSCTFVLAVFENTSGFKQKPKEMTHIPDTTLNAKGLFMWKLSVDSAITEYSGAIKIQFKLSFAERGTLKTSTLEYYIPTSVDYEELTSEEIGIENINGILNIYASMQNLHSNVISQSEQAFNRYTEACLMYNGGIWSDREIKEGQTYKYESLWLSWAEILEAKEKHTEEEKTLYSAQRKDNNREEAVAVVKKKISGENVTCYCFLRVSLDDINDMIENYTVGEGGLIGVKSYADLAKTSARSASIASDWAEEFAQSALIASQIYTCGGITGRVVIYDEYSETYTWGENYFVSWDMILWLFTIWNGKLEANYEQFPMFEDPVEGKQSTIINVPSEKYNINSDPIEVCFWGVPLNNFESIIIDIWNSFEGIYGGYVSAHLGAKGFSEVAADEHEQSKRNATLARWLTLGLLNADYIMDRSVINTDIEASELTNEIINTIVDDTRSDNGKKEAKLQLEETTYFLRHDASFIKFMLQTYPIGRDTKSAKGYADDAKGYADEMGESINAHNDSSESHHDIRDSIASINSRLAGEGRAFVFDTFDAFKAFITDTTGTAKASFNNEEYANTDLITGDMFYIIDSNVPDFWFARTNSSDPITYKETELVVKDSAGNQLGCAYVFEIDTSPFASLSSLNQVKMHINRYEKISEPSYQNRPMQLFGTDVASDYAWIKYSSGYNGMPSEEHIPLRTSKNDEIVPLGIRVISSQKQYAIWDKLKDSDPQSANGSNYFAANRLYVDDAVKNLASKSSVDSIKNEIGNIENALRIINEGE
jgi:hypothetical protein